MVLGKWTLKHESKQRLFYLYFSLETDAFVQTCCLYLSSAALILHVVFLGPYMRCLWMLLRVAAG